MTDALTQGDLPPTTSSRSPAGRLCIVAILRDELPFLDEWLAYHRLLGVDHFFLYDDDPSLPLAAFALPHRDYVTVIPWYGRHAAFPGINRQTKAYLHALPQVRGRYKWLAYLDIDEFIVLRQHADLPAFLAEFDPYQAVTLCWHVFGHNGYFADPPGLITASLTRRMAEPRVRCKTISRPEMIVDIHSAHQCILKPGTRRVDPNKRPFREEVYPGKSRVAYVNHYFCRSFQHWMRRPARGSVIDDVLERYPENRWKHQEELCLRRFVEIIAVTANEMVDESMLRFKEPIEKFLAQRGILTHRTSL